LVDRVAADNRPQAAPAVAAAPGEPGRHAVLRGVAEMFTPEAAAKGLGLDLVLAAPDGPVAAYPLMRVLANIVSNAIKYTPAGRVQFTGKPCSLSASRTSGFMILRSSGSQRAGGEGMEMVEPALSAGMASTAHPKPVLPSVQ